MSLVCEVLACAAISVALIKATRLLITLTRITKIVSNAATATTAGNITATSNSTLTSLPNLTSVGTVTSGTWSGTAIPLNNGGTGATNAEAARANLGLVIGTNVQAPLTAGTDYQTPLIAGSNYIVPNSSIAANTKTKITFELILIKQTIHLLKKEQADSGAFSFRNEIQVGFLEQEPELNPKHSILEAVLDSKNPVIQAVQNYEKALLSGTGFDHALEQIQIGKIDKKCIGALFFHTTQHLSCRRGFNKGIRRSLVIYQLIF